MCTEQTVYVQGRCLWHPSTCYSAPNRTKKTSFFRQPSMVHTFNIESNIDCNPAKILKLKQEICGFVYQSGQTLPLYSLIQPHSLYSLVPIVIASPSQRPNRWYYLSITDASSNSCREMVVRVPPRRHTHDLDDLRCHALGWAPGAGPAVGRVHH